MNDDAAIHIVNELKRLNQHLAEITKLLRQSLPAAPPKA